MAKNTRQYIFSEAQTRTMFIGSAVLMLSGIIGILILVSARPKAEFSQRDNSQFLTTAHEASEVLNGYQKLDDDRVSIPIASAMELVVERGTASPFTQAGTEEILAQAGESQVDGQAIYVSNCSACHQADGQGLAGTFPSLVGHTPELYKVDRDYLAMLVLYGLSGEITVLDQPFNGVMPAWSQLSDEELAATLNYVLTAWGNETALENFEPYTSADFTNKRDQELSSNDTYALRQSLGLP